MKWDENQSHAIFLSFKEKIISIWTASFLTFNPTVLDNIDPCHDNINGSKNSTFGHSFKTVRSDRTLYLCLVLKVCLLLLFFFLKQFQQSCSTRLKIAKIGAIVQLLSLDSNCQAKEEKNKIKIPRYLSIFDKILEKPSEN